MSTIINLRRVKSVFIFLIVSFLSVFLYNACSWESKTGRRARLLNEHETKIKASINPLELQAWATNLLHRGDSCPREEMHILLPPDVKKIEKSEPYILLETIRDDVNAWEVCIYLGWRTESGIKGLKVGYPTGKLLRQGVGMGYSHEWMPGIFIFYDFGE